MFSNRETRGSLIEKQRVRQFLFCCSIAKQNQSLLEWTLKVVCIVGHTYLLYLLQMMITTMRSTSRTTSEFTTTINATAHTGILGGAGA